MKQSTVSYGIEKLRAAFSDPILVREADRQVTTARGAQIIAAVALRIRGPRGALAAAPARAAPALLPLLPPAPPSE